jgi:hypothetical protein
MKEAVVFEGDGELVVLFEQVVGFAQRGSVGLIGGPTATPFEGVIDLTVV